MRTVEEQSQQRTRTAIALTLLVVFAFIGGAGTLLFGSPAYATPSSHKGPEGVLIYNVPNLAPATTRDGQTVDGISCRKQAAEKVTYHVHVHVAVYVNGQMKRLPAGIGITPPRLLEKYSNGHFYDVGLYDCLYWLHTHVADGIVHVETPGPKNFTLGQFFDIWNQPLSPSQVGPAKGKVVVFENGKRLTGNPRLTPLLAHGDIQIDVGKPVVPFHKFHFKVTGGCGAGTTSCALPKT
ncbi:MAG TPA: hypothetical protein VNT80_02940 [Acidimicrobiales bacterium]|nr:hypothetical protein [Acidimicrobiales bacterium]